MQLLLWMTSLSNEPKWLLLTPKSSAWRLPRLMACSVGQNSPRAFLPPMQGGGEKCTGTISLVLALKRDSRGPGKNSLRLWGWSFGSLARTKKIYVGTQEAKGQTAHS